jgi:hydroxyacylglutathione hydrolase
VPLLGSRRPPREMAVAEVLSNPDFTVLDTRVDRNAFMSAHLSGSLYAPATRQFMAATGAFVEPGQSIVLLAPPEDLDDLSRQLDRIGLGPLAGWLPIAAFDAWRDSAGATSSIDRISFPEAVPPGEDSVWVDVRGAAEFAADHVPGALQIALSRLGVEHDRIPRGQPVTVHCATGGRAALASAYLQRLGFEVRYVDDDFVRWRQAHEVGPIR